MEGSEEEAGEVRSMRTSESRGCGERRRLRREERRGGVEGLEREEEGGRWREEETMTPSSAIVELWVTRAIGRRERKKEDTIKIS